MKAALKCRDYVLDRPFGLVVGLYIVILVLGAGCMLCPYCKSGHYEAARELKYNHRIVSGDVRRQNKFAASLGFYTVPPPSLAGKYVTAKSSILAGRELLAADLGENADMKVPVDKRALPFALPANSAALLALLDAGMDVVLVAEGKEPVPATVHAIVCESGKSGGGGCYPILHIDKNQSQDVLKNSNLRLMLSSQP